RPGEAASQEPQPRSAGNTGTCPVCQVRVGGFGGGGGVVRPKRRVVYFSPVFVRATERGPRFCQPPRPRRYRTPAAAVPPARRGPLERPPFSFLLFGNFPPPPHSS